LEIVYLTREGLVKIEQELRELETVVRKRATERLEEARKQGDLAENSEYDAAKEDLAQIDYRIAQIRQKLSNVQILDSKNVGVDQIRILNKVTILDLRLKQKFTYTLVPPEEMDIDQGLISVKSPVGKALLGKKAGEIAEFTVPAGAKKWKILKIEAPDT